MLDKTLTSSSLKLKIPLKDSGRACICILYVQEGMILRGEFKKFKYSLTPNECPWLNRICKENMKGIMILFVKLTLTSSLCDCMFFHLFSEH